MLSSLRLQFYRFNMLALRLDFFSQQVPSLNHYCGKLLGS